MKYFILSLLFSLIAGCSQPKLNQSELKTLEIAPRTQVEAKGTRWMISTQGRDTTRIAHQVLESGGNLIDAAIAASFAISVERPHSTGIGGGGFLIYHESKTGKNYVFDFRERAPRRSHRDLFLDQKGNVIPDLSITGGLSVGTPGLVRGLKQIHNQFGKKPWKTLVLPSARLAREGFEIYPSLFRALEEEKPVLSRFTSSRKIFIKPDGSIPRVGEVLKQEDLAHTLEIVSQNPEDFYQGTIARKIVKSLEVEKGILGMADLKSYPVRIREPLMSSWKGYEVITMPPPSSGGIHVLQILKMLEGDTMDFLSPLAIHRTASAMQIAFADRAVYLGDPDFVRVPTSHLLDQNYLRQRRAEIIDFKARKKTEVLAGRFPELDEESNTTHFSMMDAEGNAVVSTQTINGYFGSGLVAEGTGIVLNNEMDDFSAKPGTENLFGAVGGDANAIAPRKTPLSSMSPTLVLKKGLPILAVGAPGGTRIITSVAQTILNYLYYRKDLFHSVATARFHQQWNPDVLFLELPAETKPEMDHRTDFTNSTVRALEAWGWEIRRSWAQSHVMAVARNPDDLVDRILTGVSDPRDNGISMGK